MSLYSDMALTVKDMFTEFGQDMVISRMQPGAYDTSTGLSAVSITLTQTAKGVVFDYDFKNVDRTLIKQGDKQVYLDAVSLPSSPIIDDTIAFNGSNYTIKSIKALSPAGIVVMYELNVG